MTEGVNKHVNQKLQSDAFQPIIPEIAVEYGLPTFDPMQTAYDHMLKSEENK